MKERMLRICKATAVAALAVSNVFLFTPVILYSGNRGEFSAPLVSILATYAAPAFVITLSAGVVGAIVSRDGFSRYLAILAALAVLTWVQGSILVWDYGVLDGSPIPWLETAWRGALDTSLWVTVGLLAIYKHHRYGKALIFAAASTFLIQLVAIVNDWSRNEHVDVTAANEGNDTRGYEAMYHFSPTANVLHIVMDGFQSDIFADIIRDPTEKELSESLSGFTFFDQHTGMFPYTQPTVPLLLSGKGYRNHMPIEDFVTSTLQGETILNAAATAGYEVDIASMVSLQNIYARGDHTNAYTIPGNLHTSAHDFQINDAAKLIDLALFRVTPHFVKAYIYQDQLWLVQAHFRDEAYLHLRYFADIAFLQQVEQNLVADRSSPVYKLFHVMLSHRPTVGNARCGYDGIKQTSRLNVTAQARCGLSRVAAILDRMKEIGVYDDSIIILMSDHGAWVPPAGYVSTTTDGATGPSATLAAQALPTLAIKPRGARGPLHVRSSPTTIADVPKTIAALMGLNAGFTGRNAFDVPVDEKRERTFFTYAYGNNRKAPGYYNPMLEYKILGNPFDYSSWRRLGLHEPAAEQPRD